MEEWEKDDELQLQRMLDGTDDETRLWMQKKSKDLLKLMSYYRGAMMEVETRFNVLNHEHILEHNRNPISTIKIRLKTLPSIEEKLRRRGLPFSFPSIEENLDNIAGVRVICPFPDDVYAMADSFLSQDVLEYLKKSAD